MATKYITANCPECGFPVSGQAGKTISCPNCRITGKISGVDIPSELFWAGIAFVAGLVLRPYLQRKAAKYIS